MLTSQISLSIWNNSLKSRQSLNISTFYAQRISPGSVFFKKKIQQVHDVHDGEKPNSRSNLTQNELHVSGLIFQTLLINLS